MGDIGEPIKHIEFEPIPEDVPAPQEPAAPEPATAPAEPAPAEPEKVPA